MPIMTALAGIVPPVLIAAILVMSAWRPWRRGVEPGPSRDWAAAGAVGLSLAVAFPLVTGSLAFPPRSAVGWLPMMGLVAWVTGAGRTAWIRPFAVRALVAVVVCELAAWLILRPMLRHAWLGGEGWARVLGLGGVAAVVWVLLVPLERRGARVPLVMWVASVGSAVVLVMSETASLAQASGVLAVGLGVLVVVAWWRPGLPIARGAAGPWAMLQGAILMGGYAYAGTPPGLAAVVLLMVAPLGAWVAEVGALSRRPAWMGTVAAMAAAGAACGACGAALALR
ncbi:MAG: hypothetical protein ACKVW3_05180 [Phycisphaerales bacterium]